MSAALTNGDKDVQVSVRDDGDGIAADVLPLVFDLFMQGNTSFDRTQGGLGWFVTTNLETKVEYVRQNDRDFPVTDVRNGGRFDGAMFEAVVSF